MSKKVFVVSGKVNVCLGLYWQTGLGTLLALMTGGCPAPN
jgi:hypothetical protein